MDYRKINNHIILLAIAIIVGLFVAMIARLTILAKGADTGTANLVFLIAFGICAVVYLVIMVVFSHVIIPWIEKKIPEKKQYVADTETAQPIENTPAANVERIKQDADRQYAERLKEKVRLFQRYSHRTVGPYVTSDGPARPVHRMLRPAGNIPGRSRTHQAGETEKRGSIPFRLERSQLFRTAETRDCSVVKNNIHSSVGIGRFLYQREAT